MNPNHIKSSFGALAVALPVFIGSSCLAGGSAIELVTPRCTSVGSEIVVDVRIAPGAPSVVGLQSAITYDGSVLTFLGEEPGDAPFDLPIYFVHSAPLSKIDLAVGITPPNSPSNGNVSPSGFASWCMIRRSTARLRSSFSSAAIRSSATC